LISEKTPFNSDKIIDYDVVIIGGGVAGSACATYLAKAGVKVAVIEQQSEPRQTAHSYLVAPGSLRELKKMGITLAETVIGNTITHAEVYLNGRELAGGDFPEVEDMPRLAKVVPIKALNQALLSGAHANGAHVLEGWRVINFAVETNWVTIIASNKETTRTIRSRMLVGADGVNSIVTRRLKGSAWLSTQRVIAARVLYNYVPVNPSQATLYYDTESFPGYSWIFPTSKGQADIGIGYVLGATPSQEDPKTLLEKLIANNPAIHERLENAQKIGEIEVLESNLFDKQVPLIGDRLMVIGLAAGLVNPYNGEGLQMGLLSAKWAAETIQSCKASNIYTQAALTPYTRRIEGKFGYGFQLSDTILSLLRNRSLNGTWLGELEAMGKKCNTDAQYKRIASGVLSGMIFPTEEITAQTLMGTLQQSALTGLTAFSSLLQNFSQQNTPSQPTQDAAQSASSAAQYAASSPTEALNWGLGAALQAAELAGFAAKQAFKKVQNSNQANQQQ
jgi:menaquinone-9 beta-reductase